MTRTLSPRIGGSLREPPTPSDPALRVSGLSKCFHLYEKPLDVVWEVLFRQTRHREFWALRDIDFTIGHGEIVGLIGANGAGKSTLLRILSGVLDATRGDLFVDGRLRAILELGTGFQDECTGRENVFLGGAFLGYSRQEIEASLDWIVDFAELRPFIDQPFRTYSSGMKARLTFAVTFFKKPEVMIIDEALSVGDAGFTNKCINRVIELCSDGATALVVSHNMYVIERLCRRVLYLKQGRLVADGSPVEVCKLYERDLLREFADHQEHLRAAEANRADQAVSTPMTPEAAETLLNTPGNAAPPMLHLGLVELAGIRLLDENGQSADMFAVGSPLRMEFTIDSKVAKTNVDIGVQIFHESGVHVTTTTNRFQLDAEGRPNPRPLHLRRGRQTFSVSFPRLFLGTGNYFINLGVSPNGMKHYGESNLLFLARRCLVFGFHRDDTQSQRHVIYDPPSDWEQEIAPACGG